MPRFTGPAKIRGGTSRGAHVRSLWEALTCLIDEVPTVPTERRVRLRTLRGALERAYPAELLSDTDLAHALEDDDGVPSDF